MASEWPLNCASRLQDASWLVKITSLFTLVLGFFKIFKSFSVRSRGVARKDSKQAETDEIDRLAFKYLSPPLLLLIAGYSGHSLATGYHRGWYAWLIESLVALRGCIAALGGAIHTRCAVHAHMRQH